MRRIRKNYHYDEEPPPDDNGPFKSLKGGGTARGSPGRPGNLSALGDTHNLSPSRSSLSPSRQKFDALSPPGKSPRSKLGFSAGVALFKASKLPGGGYPGSRRKSESTLPRVGGAISAAAASHSAGGGDSARPTTAPDPTRPVTAASATASPRKGHIRLGGAAAPGGGRGWFEFGDEKVGADFDGGSIKVGGFTVSPQGIATAPHDIVWLPKAVIDQTLGASHPSRHPPRPQPTPDPKGFFPAPPQYHPPLPGWSPPPPPPPEKWGLLPFGVGESTRMTVVSPHLSLNPKP
jgi:hypothetical protein